MNEADLAVLHYACNPPIDKSHCLPAVGYLPFYFFSRYPLETTKVWNLLKLLTPTSWIWTLFSIISIVMILKCFTLVGTHLGCKTLMQDITLVPFRYRVNIKLQDQNTILIAKKNIF